MEQYGKAFLGLILIVILSFTGVGIISASIDASHAEQYASNIATYIESSNFSEKVIEKCKETAKEKGYELTVNTSDSNDDGWIDFAEINLTYDYSISVLNVKGSKHTAKAYAR